MCLVVAARGAFKIAPELIEAISVSASNALSSRGFVRYETLVGPLWFWGATARPLDPVGLVAGMPAADDLVIGIGSPQPGVAGFRRSHKEACEAARFGLDGHRGVVPYGEMALLINMTRDLETAGWLVREELGEIANCTPAASELRSTLLAFYAARMRLASAASSLHMHRNTLINRLQRVEKIPGHPLAERAAELQCALLLVQELGPERFAADRATARTGTAPGLWMVPPDSAGPAVAASVL